VVRDAFTSEADVKDIATKYEISPSTLSEWKRDALSGKDIKRVKELGKKLAESEAKNDVLLMVLGKKGSDHWEDSVMEAFQNDGCRFLS